ncbi:MAG: hypothetical protein LIR46_01590 [Bacteroidota bacterium]|nr:hypothetical protein [Bacteroidota bacterium]
MAQGWRGFGPEGDRFGHRGFSLIAPDAETAQEWTDWGYNVHVMPPRDEGGEPGYRLPVTVNFKYFDNRRPEVIMVTKRGGETKLDDGTVENQMISCLDYADIAKMNVTIVPRNHGDTSRGGTGVTAYLRDMKVWIAENETMDDDEAPWD